MYENQLAHEQIGCLYSDVGVKVVICKSLEEPWNQLGSVLAARYLGIQVDNNLNWKGHIKALSSKINILFLILKHANSFLAQDTLRRYIVALLSCTLDAAALYGKTVMRAKEAICKNFKTERQGYSHKAVITLTLGHFWRVLGWKRFRIWLIMKLLLCFSKPLMV